MSEHATPGSLTPPPTPTPASRDPRGRRRVIALGAGAAALAGLATAGAGALLAGSGDTSGPAPQRPEPNPEPLTLDKPVLGSPPPAGGAGAAASRTPEASPSPSPEADPSSANSQEVQKSTSRRVLHDPSDGDMPDGSTAAEGDTPPAHDPQEQASFADVEPSEAFRAAPPEPTLTATSPLAPGLTLETTEAWHLARRAGIAVSAADVANIDAMGATAWIAAQLDPEAIDDSWVEGVISEHFPWVGLTAAEIEPLTDDSSKTAPQLTNALLLRYRFSKRVLAENVIETLANHVYVPSYGKAPSFTPEYDRMLRQHAMGRYADLLHAALTHPALLIELDNQVNTQENPNENLGRELLELYTVGVGNYTETDVRQSALLLTGHGIEWETRTYLYRAKYHHTGPLQVMDFTDANADADAGPELLRRYADYLASHPGTAQRLAHRFAVRFIADEPSQDTVDALAQAYLDADTSIPALVTATLTHPEFNKSAGQKWRRPTELIGSIARAAQVQHVTPRGRLSAGEPYNYGVYGWLIETGRDLPRAWPVVDGYPDTASYWNSASNTLQMLNATQDAVIGDKEESGQTSWATALSIAAGDNVFDVAKRITWHLTGYRWPEAHLSHVASMLLGGGQPTADSTMAGEHLDHRVGHAVRVTFASPYASLR